MIMTRSPELDYWLSEWSDKIREWELSTGKEFLGDQEIVARRPRGRFECWLDRHNHKMELLRTFTSAAAAIASLAVFLKVFGVV